MENKELRIRVQMSAYSFDTEMIFYESGIDSKIINVGKLIMEPFTLGSVIPEKSRIILDSKTEQILMDDLWSCGVRPTEGKGSAGSMAATEKHLNDFRKIIEKQLEIKL